MRQRGVVLCLAAITCLAGAGSAQAATFTVTNTNDSGAGSLRRAIGNANATAATDTIQFSIGTGIHEIKVTSGELPTITHPVVIDATTQPGYSGTPLIRLHNATGTSTYGLTITAGSSTVRGLSITNFGGGILLETGGSNTISGNWLGVRINGDAAGNAVGVIVDSADNTIGGPTGRNVISGNSTAGVAVLTQDATSNLVANNYIGTTSTGTGSLPNGDGVFLSFGARGNTIGGTTGSARNIISGNAGYGVNDQSGPNTIEGNYIGTDKSGAVGDPNGSGGVTVGSGHGDTIGGTSDGARNVISSNSRDGVLLTAGAEDNIVEGNYIGVDKSGAKALGNAFEGVHIDSGSTGNTIGGTSSGARNVISGNDGAGIGLINSGTSGNVVEGNYIGTDPAGTSAVPNGNGGVYLSSGPSGNTIGGTTGGARNVISGNAGNGVLMQGSSSGNFVKGNFIGVDKNGTSAVPNSGSGVAIYSSATDTIGGDAAAKNVISGNKGDGVLIGINNFNAIVYSNLIGTNAAGTAAIPNGGDGIDVTEKSTSTVIGGTNKGNLVSGNKGAGIHVTASDTKLTEVDGNLIGTDKSGTAPLANQQEGVLISGGASDTGVGVSGPPNTIAFNQLDGVLVNGSTSVANTIRGNSIFSNGGLGIHLKSGGNDLQPAPTVKSVTTSGGVTTIKLHLQGFAPSTEFGLDVLVSPSCDPSGAGEGKTVLGFVNVTTDSSGTGNTQITEPALHSGQVVTATATNNDTRDTSQFSTCVAT
ncbi:MAG TPA: hypothetical protein VFA66_13260 [Gaiellaceae bacterium]|nr:hypothetical protein [Gaiellaceae bacterium]